MAAHDVLLNTSRIQSRRLSRSSSPVSNDVDDDAPANDRPVCACCELDEADDTDDDDDFVDNDDGFVDGGGTSSTSSTSSSAPLALDRRALSKAARLRTLGGNRGVSCTIEGVVAAAGDDVVGAAVEADAAETTV